jgi:hypothetical protein
MTIHQDIEQPVDTTPDFQQDKCRLINVRNFSSFLRLISHGCEENNFNIDNLLLRMIKCVVRMQHIRVIFL